MRFLFSMWFMFIGNAIFLPFLGRLLVEVVKYFSADFANWPQSRQHLVFLAPGLIVILGTLGSYIERFSWFAAGTVGGVRRGPERDAMMRRWTKEGFWGCAGFIAAILLLLLTGQYRLVAGLQ